ncbi:MAG: hypothetical protein ACPL7K_09570 [Armatimonadota bacterium]
MRKFGSDGRLMVVIGLVAAAVVASTTASLAASFTAQFPSPSSSFVASTTLHFKYFWSVSRGDCIYQQFTGTGITAVDRILLDFVVDENALDTVPVNWDVRINGTTVGSWSWGPQDGTGPVSLDYSFAPITGNGSYLVGMYVTNEVPSGLGSISLAETGTMTLMGDRSADVPEWNSLLLAIFGLGSALGAGRLCKRA